MWSEVGRVLHLVGNLDFHGWDVPDRGEHVKNLRLIHVLSPLRLCSRGGFSLGSGLKPWDAVRIAG